MAPTPGTACAKALRWDKTQDVRNCQTVVVGCVTLDETREVRRVFRAVKDSGLYLTMVGQLLNSFKQRSDMILNRKATGYIV